jgi:hypothetical protein
MLHFVSTRLAISYLLLCTLGCLGVLQVQAARQRLVGLSLCGGRCAPWWGYVGGFLILLGSFSGFFAFAPGIFVPGLAGSELMVLFAAGCVLAIMTSLVSASLTVPRTDSGSMGAIGGEQVSGPQLRGWLYVPRGATAHPALCLIPEVGNPAGSLARLTALLMDLGFVTLTIDWSPGGGKDHLPRYPDVLALVPAAVDYLCHRPGIDSSRIGIIGFDIGGDLALRAGGTDERLAAILAVSPRLQTGTRNPSLDLLRDGSLWQSVQRQHQHRAQAELLEAMDVSSFLPRITPRPLLILHQPWFPAPLSLGGLETRSLPDTHHGLHPSEETVQMIGQWCAENLS